MERFWQANYPEGVPTDISVPPGETLLSLFLDATERYADRVAFSCAGARITYRELREKAMQFAGYLRGERGLVQGDRVALMLPNIIQYPVVLYGTILAGCVPVNLNPLDKAGNLCHQLVDADVKAMVVLEHFVGELQKIIHETQLEEVVVTSIGAMFGPLKRLLVNVVIRQVRREVPSWSLPKFRRYGQALRAGAKHSYERPEIEQTDLALLQYTGGTTGKAKGVMLTHLNMLSNLEQAKVWTQSLLNDRGERIITALPLYHIFSLLANCLLFMKLGGENILIPNPRDLKGFVKVLVRESYSCITGVNTLFNALLQQPTFCEHARHKPWKLALGGGMAIQQSVAQSWQSVTGVPISQAYGMTETSPAICISPMGVTHFNGTVGLPVPSTDLSIRSPSGDACDINQPGEIWVRGPQVMAGYWRQPEATAEAIQDGWLRTGDVAVIDASGYVTIVDRAKDMIIVSGFNVYPAEIEDCIALLPAVAEVAVVGETCSKRGEVVKAFVVCAAGESLTEQAVRDHCYAELANYKVPKTVVFCEDLPKSTVGKILRNQLR